MACIRASQEVALAEQVASSVSVTRTTDFSAWKKDWEDWLSWILVRNDELGNEVCRD